MSRLLATHPNLFAGGALLLGSIALSAATHYGYQAFSVDLLAQPACVWWPCDAEDIDDCGAYCVCNDTDGSCVTDPPL